MASEVRIDKWLWAVRIFKTRSIAADAIKMGRVTIGGQKVKASRNVKIGEVIDVKKPPITYSFKVLALAENRMGAKMVPGFMENVTRQEQLDLLQMSRISGFIDRAKGLGRPTKKDRRDMDDFTTPEYVDEFDFSLEDLDDPEIWAEVTEELSNKDSEL
ncbi:MAG: RNA-binding S4 domain-containing protein [Bacteroidales bacterium]|jgi:ribosome-associated heat shock protein Hsp15|nr:RNA-binding S4 domain-containing protein [Bacteroidales bacterium]